MKRYFWIVLMLMISIEGFTQQEVDRLMYRASGYFDVGNYSAALPLFVEAIEKGENHSSSLYRAGYCYMEEKEIADRIKAISYFERSMNASGSENLPDEIYLKLGSAYLLNEETFKALDTFRKFSEESDEKKRLISMANNAVYFLQNKRDIEIKDFGEPINSEFTEYSPVVSADESVLAYTHLIPEGKSFVEEIKYVSRDQSGNWSFPVALDISTRGNAGTAGISADGQKLIIFIGSGNNTGDLYTIDKAALGWNSPISMGNHVNSRYLESTASVTPDDKVIYFASNRPGGYGGVDIYKVEKDENGRWSTPQNLGSDINTPYDDGSPFIHPDKKTLFFTSEGHNTMGGKDIFKAELVQGKWRKPENMGYPINTTANDNYFTLTADGSRGYFSSDRLGGLGGQDIYYFDMPEGEANIPLTMVKGRILAGENLEPVPTQIKVVDVELSSKIDYVYNPNKETGEYLIIFPPGKSYDIIIESEGFLPYTLNINIPNQDYFYELYQQIHLLPIKQFGVVVGQEVEVKNMFYDTRSETNLSPKMANESRLIKQDSIDIYDIMDGIISTSDTVAMEYLLDLMYTSTPLRSVDFDSENPNIESAGRQFFYDESGEHNLEMKIAGTDTIYTLPTFFVTEEANKKYAYSESEITYDAAVLSKVSKIYYEVGQSALRNSDHEKLDQVMAMIDSHEALGIEISGYASVEGDEEQNRKLSNERAISVLNYFNQKGVVRRRIIAKGYGATKSEASSKEESRRVEIRIVDLNKR